MRETVKQIVYLTILVGLALVFGTVGYVLIEHWSWFDGLYMTVVTLGTVGYGETHPLSDAGRLFTMLLILFASGVVLYAVAALTALIVEGKLVDQWRQTRMQKAIDALSGHFIVCGYGSTGRYVVEELHRTRQPLVVIESDPARLHELRTLELLCVEGDATHEDSLLRAGIVRARGLVACLHTDADNVFVALSARALNADLRIVAKAVEERSQRKLRAVGADGVVLPNFIGGLRLVMELTRPNAITLLDMVMRAPNQSILAEEIAIPHDSRWVGEPLAALGLAETDGVSLVAVQRMAAPGYRFNPPSDTRLEAGDVLILMGEAGAVGALIRRLGSPAPLA